jgi:hypothetical protein
MRNNDRPAAIEQAADVYESEWIRKDEMDLGDTD